MLTDTALREALKAGMRWLTTTVQPPGAAVHPAGEHVIAGDRMFVFRLTDGAGPVASACAVEIRPADGPGITDADRMRVETALNALGHGVIGVERDDDAVVLVSGTTPAPSLVAAMRAHGGGLSSVTRRPPAVRADFTRVLEGENERLREELKRMTRAAESFAAVLRTGTGR